MKRPMGFHRGNRYEIIPVKLGIRKTNIIPFPKKMEQLARSTSAHTQLMYNHTTYESLMNKVFREHKNPLSDK